MDYLKYILVLGVFFMDSDAGGHEDNHHDHVKLHLPEFIHHNHHTKVITIHHHHHKPKKEHHHHHHHHHKPHIPHGPPHFYTHHHSKSSSKTSSKGHTHVGHKGHHGNHGHSGSHSHHKPKHHETKTSYDPPAINYAPPSTSINYNPSPSFGSVSNEYGSFLPSESVPIIPNNPHVHGVVHTVKQVKVFDSLPGSLLGSAGNTGTSGYQVTEHQADEGDEDVFTSVNSLSQSYPGTYGFVRNAAEETGNDPFLDISQAGTAQSQHSDPFASAQQPPNYSNLEDFTIQSQSSGSPYLQNAQTSQFSAAEGFSDPSNSAVGDLSSTSFLAFPEGVSDDTAVTFSREAGLQHAVNTAGIETIAY